MHEFIKKLYMGNGDQIGEVRAMPSSQDIFNDLNDSGPTFHGIARPDPSSYDHILFSSHDDVNNGVAVPVDQIKNVTRSGELRGLAPDYHSVDLTFKKSIESLQPTFSDIMAISNRTMIEKTNPVYCYDQNGNWVPCP